MAEADCTVWLSIVYHEPYICRAIDRLIDLRGGGKRRNVRHVEGKRSRRVTLYGRWSRGICLTRRIFVRVIVVGRRLSFIQVFDNERCF